MPHVLITAFEAYAGWKQNSSWLTLIELTRSLPDRPRVTTRRLPSDFAGLRERLAAELSADYDYALHLGQAPGRGRIELEMLGVNIAGDCGQPPDQFVPLAADGPPAYRCSLPLAGWSAKIRNAGIPCQLSYHAGTYLCNATLYLSHLLVQQRGWKTQSTFIHLPLEVSQVLEAGGDLPAMPVAAMSAAIRLILEELSGELV